MLTGFLGSNFFLIQVDDFVDLSDKTGIFTLIWFLNPEEIFISRIYVDRESMDKNSLDKIKEKVDALS
jgi:hypothetical protein